MPLTLAVLLPFIAQVGPSGTQIQAPLEIPKRRTVVSKPGPEPAPPRLRLSQQRCYAEVRSDPAAALASAEAVLAGKSSVDRTDALACKAIALSGLERWDEALTAFAAAREALPQSDSHGRAEMDAGAAIAAEGQGAFAAALAHFEQAQALARQANDPALVGRLARDKANSLFRLGRKDEAAAALAEARTALPADPITFTISARAARLAGKLGEAQGYIEKAATLAPLDPDIGLEAGVIAVLGGRDAAARRSWQSVISAAPDSDAAKVAKGYLDQLGPDTAPSTR
jgi:tetratricopeptide (TPR) repeat protein